MSEQPDELCEVTAQFSDGGLTFSTTVRARNADEAVERAKAQDMLREDAWQRADWIRTTPLIAK